MAVVFIKTDPENPFTLVIVTLEIPVRRLQPIFAPSQFDDPGVRVRASGLADIMNPGTEGPETVTMVVIEWVMVPPV